MKKKHFCPNNVIYQCTLKQLKNWRTKKRVRPLKVMLLKKNSTELTQDLRDTSGPSVDSSAVHWRAIVSVQWWQSGSHSVWGTLNYTRTQLKITNKRSNTVMNPNLDIWFILLLMCIKVVNREVEWLQVICKTGWRLCHNLELHFIEWCGKLIKFWTQSTITLCSSMQ